MARWELDLGIVLFSRVGREVSLTPAGVALATAATRAAAFLESAIEDLRNETRPEALALGFLRSLGPTIVGELVSSFHAQAPGVLVSHREGASSELLDDLEAGRLDIVVVGPRPTARYGWLRLGRQTLSLVVPAHHRLAGLDAVDLADASEESFLSLDSRYSTRQQADELCTEAGFEPRILLEADDARTVRDYVAGGLGIAILPTDTSVNPRVVNLPIRSPNASREIGLAWDLHRRLGPVGASFRDNAEELVSRYPGVADLLDS